MNSALQAKYDFLVDRYEERKNDEIDLENVHDEMHKYWRLFLDAGLDVDQIAKMMSLTDAWGNYDVLEERGASFEIPLFIKNFDKKFVDENWVLFVSRGANPDDLARKVYTSITCYSDMKAIIERGASVRFVIELLSGEVGPEEESTLKEPLQVFSYLRRNGMTQEELNDWIDANMSNSLLCSILGEYADAWKSIGVDPEDYIDAWFERNSEYYLDPNKLEELPKYITVERFIGFFPVDTFIKQIQSFGPFLNFLDYEFKEAGCNVDSLSERFIDEIGYSNEKHHLDAMFGLIMAGASNIDIRKFVDLVRGSRIDRCSREFYYDDLKWKGVDEGTISLLLS